MGPDELAANGKAAVSRSNWAHGNPWIVWIPKTDEYHFFTYWQDAIAFADREMRKR